MVYVPPPPTMNLVSALRNAYAERDPFYSRIGSNSGDGIRWDETPAIGGPAGFLEQNQDAAYARMMEQMGLGLGNNSPYAQFMRDQFRNTQTGFKAALANNPLLTYQGPGGYLSTTFNVPKLRATFNRLSPRMRGENNSLYGGPMRTLADV